MAEPSLRKRIWGWYFFDWASQPYHTVLNTFIFGPFFASLAATFFIGQGLDETAADAEAQALWSRTVAIIGVVTALFAPIFGAMADSNGRRLPWIIAFSILTALGSASLWFTQPDASNLYWMLAAFGVGFVAVEWALIFTNSQLPDLGTEDEIGKISGSGFAFGYLGGLTCLILALVLFVEQPNGKTIAGLDPLFGLSAEDREGTRSIGPLVSLWFVLFMVPYFMWVREVRTDAKRASVSEALGHVVKSIKGLADKVSLRTYLISSMLYRDALNGLYTFGGVYATLVLNWPVAFIGVFGIVGALGACVMSYVGGFADRRFGPKPVVVFSIIVLMFVSFTVINISPGKVFGVELSADSPLPNILFFACGVFIGGLGGVLQSASRSLMVRHCDEGSKTEYFGLYGLAGRATAFLAPTLIYLATTTSGSAQIGVSPVIGLFAVGLIMLMWVNKDGEKT